MEFKTSNTSFKSRCELVNVMIASMKQKSGKTGKAGVLLAGDPGVGKTSFIRFFSNLMGIHEITIEAPHITEEHIINIPFLVYDPQSKRETKGNTELEPESSGIGADDFKVVLSDSNLYSKLNSIKKIPDNEYLRNIYAGPSDVRAIFESFGGTKDTIPTKIQRVRNKFKSILFLDEYFRQTSTKIRNVLRGILDNKIGSHDIPPDVWTVYATNLKDTGDAVENIPLNNDFHVVTFGAPNKDDWFSWLVAKFEKDEKVKLKLDVIKKFYELLEEEHLSIKLNDVRSSPRRWEQLILYVNSSLPVKSTDEAKALLTNVKTNFWDYSSGNHSDLTASVMHAVTELIEETSNIKVDSDDVLPATKWEATLEHQIKQKMALGHHRKYIPIISGLPGVGKTTFAQKIAKDLNLRYIYVNVSQINAEDVVGIPIPKSKNKKQIETGFSLPSLFDQIMKDVEKTDADHIAHIKHKFSGKEQKAEIEKYKNAEWKYLIFFDELNRNSSRVFNGIRRVLLEKSFGEGHDLPAGSIVMAAINPKDVGAEELTDHMKDVVDVIHTAPSFLRTKEIAKAMDFEDLDNPVTKDIVYSVFTEFVETFKMKAGSQDSDSKNYYIDIPGGTAYMSPREFTDLVSMATLTLDLELTDVLEHLKTLSGERLEEAQAQAEHDLRICLFKSFESKLTGVFVKQHIDGEVFFHTLKEWFLANDKIDFGEGIFYTKAETDDLESILKKYFDDPKDDKHLADDMSFINYLTNIGDVKFQEDVQSFFTDRLQNDIDVVKHLIDTGGKKGKYYNQKSDAVEFTDEEVSKLEHIFREMNVAIKKNKFSYKYNELMAQGAKLALKQFAPNEHGAEILAFMAKIKSILRQTVKELT